MKKIKSLVVSILVLALLCVSTSIVAFANVNLDKGTYKVSITSLETKAPLPSVKKAVATAFGDYAIVKVNDDGSATATMQNQHMKISDSDANILTIKDSTVDSTKSEDFTNPKTKAQETVNCPDVFTISLDLDDNNSQVITVTVDYMNQFLGGGSDYETDLTLTLDMANAQKVDDNYSFSSSTEDTTVAITENKSSALSTKTKIIIAVHIPYIQYTLMHDVLKARNVILLMVALLVA